MPAYNAKNPPSPSASESDTAVSATMPDVIRFVAAQRVMPDARSLSPKLSDATKYEKGPIPIENDAMTVHKRTTTASGDHSK